MSESPEKKTPKIIYYIAFTTDGFIAEKDGSVAFLDEYQNSKHDYGYAAFYDTIDVIIMGTGTYEKILTFGDWPYKGKKTYVVTSRKASYKEDGNVEFFDGSVSEVAALAKSNSKKNVWFCGGGKLAAPFFEQELMDECRFAQMPVLIGDGIRLFPSGLIKSKVKLALLYSRTFDDGVVECNYNVVKSSST